MSVIPNCSCQLCSCIKTECLLLFSQKGRKHGWREEDIAWHGREMPTVVPAQAQMKAHKKQTNVKEPLRSCCLRCPMKCSVLSPVPVCSMENMGRQGRQAATARCRAGAVWEAKAKEKHLEQVRRRSHTRQTGKNIHSLQLREKRR